MSVQFVNALNAAAAAESECAKLKRLLEEERKLVQRLREEKEDEEDEAQLAKRKFERMSQRLAEAQKDVEYATARADVAENEWSKLKRELREAQEFLQLPKPESEETRRIVLRQGDDKELQLANAPNAASIAESKCDKLRTLLEEERKLVQRLIVEKDDEAQLAKRKIEEIGEELANARKDAEYATARADAAETEWIKAKKELQEERELSRLLKPECDELRQSAMRQVEEKERELVNVLHASEIAELECAKLKRMLEEEEMLVQRLIVEKDDEVQLARRQIEEIEQELAHARQDAELARKDADAAETEWIKAKKELQEERELSRLLKPECDEIRLSAMRQVEEKERELVDALHASTRVAERECAQLQRMLEEEKILVQRLIVEKDDEVRLARRQIEEIDQELAHARQHAELARKDADAAVNELTEVKRDVKSTEEHVELLKLQCQEIAEIASRQDEEKALQLANAVNASAIAESECANLKRMLIEEEETIQLLKSEIQEMRQEVEEISQELENARKEAEHAQNDADIARETSERALRQVEEKELELADALNAVASASSSSSVAQECVICLTNEKDMAFGCGHMTCEECGKMLPTCPICREDITTRIKLFPG